MTPPPLDPLAVAQYLVRRLRAMSPRDRKVFLGWLDDVEVADDRGAGIIVDALAELLAGKGGERG